MLLLLVPVASMPMMVTARPEIEVNARAIVVAIVSMPRTMPVAAMPVAPVAHLSNVRVRTRYLAKASCCATCRRGLSRCEESQRDDGYR